MSPTMDPDRKCPRCGTTLPPDAPEGLCPACLAKAAFGSEPQPTASNPRPGAPPPPPTPEEIARHFPQLEVLHLVGQGGMGVVYKVRQVKLDRIAALKILPFEYSKDPAFAERFSREARTLARLNHANIVAIYDFGEANGLFYFLMEFVDGLNLRELEQSRQLTPQQALNIVPKICDALQYAHEEGIVHRDIKPGNILIDRKGRIKIADFGLAKLLGKNAPDLTLTSAGHRMGTPHYMAPEQIEHPQAVDHRADIYSLGVVFYEMLTGELPVGRFAPPSHKVQVDVRLDEVVLRSLENNPQQRYQHASEIKTDVETISNTCPPAIPMTPATPQAVPAAPNPPTASLRALNAVKPLASALQIYAAANLATMAIPWALGLPKVLMLFNHSPVGGVPLTTWSMEALLPLPILFIASQICLLIAADRLRNLQSYGWALAAAIISILPLSPLWIVGLGLGIWTLILIHGPEVRSVLGQAPRRFLHGNLARVPSGNDLTVPRFSGKAILGACLIIVPASLLMDWLPMMLHTPGHRWILTPEWAMPFTALLIPLMIGFPIATTALGITAMKDIRYSHGRIVGLPLALFDALLFPLLLLNFGIIRALNINDGMVTTADWTEPRFFRLLLGLLLCLLFDLVIIRACWRMARPAS